jgi:Thymosin beta-4 family
MNVALRLYFIFIIEAVAAEKAHINLITGLSTFDKTTMKHTETEEKNPLPPMEGWLIYDFFFAFLLKFFDFFIIY